MTTQELMMILAPTAAGAIGSAVSSSQNRGQQQQNQQQIALQQMLNQLQQKAQIMQGLQQNRQDMAQAGLNAMPLGQEQAYVNRAKAMQALLPALAQYQGARPTDPGVAGAMRSSGPNLVQALAGNKGFQDTFGDQMTSQALADRRKAIAGVNPQYEFSSLSGFGMDPQYDQGVNSARSDALARLKGFEASQEALSDQQVALAQQQMATANQPEKKKGGGIGGFLGGILKVAAPAAALIPGVGPLAAMGIGAAASGLGSKMQGSGWGGALGSAVMGAGGALGAEALQRGGNPFGPAKGAQVYGQAAGPSLDQMMPQGGFEGNTPGLGMPKFDTSTPPMNFGQQVYNKPAGPNPAGPNLPMFNKADPRGSSGQRPNPPVPFMSSHGPQPSQAQPVGNAGQLQQMANRGQQLSPDQLQQAFGPASMAYMNQQYPDPSQALQGILASVPALGRLLGGGAAAGAAGPAPSGPPLLGPAPLQPRYVGGGSLVPRSPQLGAPQTGGLLPPSSQGMLPSGSYQMPGPTNRVFNMGNGSGQYPMLPPYTSGPTPPMLTPTYNQQLNAKSIIDTLSANNGMTVEDKARFLASPEAQRILGLLGR